jgi:hypothetical protein
MTLPHDQRSPTRIFQQAFFPPIASSVLLKLRKPIFFPRTRLATLSAPVRVPETSMNEDHSTQVWKNDIRAARKVPHVQAISQPEIQNHPTYCQFRRSSLLADPAHAPASLDRCQHVSHLGTYTLQLGTYPTTSRSGDSHCPPGNRGRHHDLYEA